MPDARDGYSRAKIGSLTATWQTGSGSSGTIFSQGLAYDAVGNVVTSTQTHAAISGQTGSGGSETQNFCYDEQNQLLWAGNSGTQPAAGTGSCGSGTLANTISGAGYSNTLSYTHLGQLWQGPLNGSGTSFQYLYCSSSHPHQLTGLYPTGTTCASLSGASYDAWGNMTSRTTGGSTAALSYDLLDHLVTWNAGSASQEWYAYDASGNRILRRSTTSSGTSITTYAFDLEEHVYSSTGTNTSNTYYYMLAGRLIGAATGTSTLSTQFFLTDALGSVLATFSATSGSATVLGNQLYGPYGNQRYSKGSMGTAKGYTGQYGDVTGLDYYNARYYDPMVGVFLSADTVQDNLGGFNPYTYVGGNPETKSDPTGHWGWALPAIADFFVVAAEAATYIGTAIVGAVLAPEFIAAVVVVAVVTAVVAIVYNAYQTHQNYQPARTSPSPASVVPSRPPVAVLSKTSGVKLGGTTILTAKSGQSQPKKSAWDQYQKTKEENQGIADALKRWRAGDRKFSNDGSTYDNKEGVVLGAKGRLEEWTVNIGGKQGHSSSARIYIDRGGQVWYDPTHSKLGTKAIKLPDNVVQNFLK